VRPHAIQRAQAALAAKKADLHGQQPAEQAKTKRRSLDDWIESLSESERDHVPHSKWFASLTEEQQVHVLRRIEAYEAVEEQAELEHQAWLERQSLKAIDTLTESEQWESEQQAASEERWEAMLANRLRDESDALTDAEQQADADLAAAIGIGVERSEELYDVDEDFEPEEGDE
jgi:hypothetical protein